MAELGDSGLRGGGTFVVDLPAGSQLETQRQRLLAITSAIADAVTADEVFQAVVDHLGRAVDATAAALWLLEADGRTARLVRAIGYSDAQVQAFAALALDGAQSLPPLDAIRRGEPLWFPSQTAMLQAYPHLATSVTPSRAYRVSCLPLISNGRMLGVLALTHDEPHDEGEHEFLLLVARYASQAIERLRLLAAERAATTRMTVLGHASRVFGELAVDDRHQVDAIVRELGAILESSVAIRLLEADGRLGTVALHHPVPEAEALLRALAVTIAMRPGEGISGEVARTGTSVLLASPAEIAQRLAPGYHEYFERFPTYAMMVVPLRTRGRIIGTVAATRTRRGETYTAEDVAMLEALADRAASAIENNRLHTESLAAGRRAEQLYRFLHTAVAAEQLDDVFTAALDAIAGDTDRAAVLLFDETGVMRFRAGRGLSSDCQRAIDGHSPWPRNATAPTPVLVPDVAADPTLASLAPLFESEQIGAFALIPLVSRSQLLGKLVVYHRAPHAYSAWELELASALANNLASVIARFTAVAELEQTLHYNKLFAGVLAHDLRNPLGAIMTASQLLLMRGEGDRNAKPLSRILNSGQRMLRMIDQLLDVTRARVGGGIEIEPRDTNLADVCSLAISELELVYPDRVFRCDVAGDLGGLWDPDRLAQMISNLAANASQHGSGTEVLLRLDGTSADSVVFTVHNTGVIPEPLRETLFDPFRGARQRRDLARGLGLGLFIVKELVRAHGGSIAVSTTDTDGTTFEIHLPRRARARD